MLPVLALGVPGLVLAGYAGLARRARRRGLGHAFLAPFEEMWDPAGRRTETVIQAGGAAGAAAPAPGDRPPAG